MGQCFPRPNPNPIRKFSNAIALVGQVQLWQNLRAKRFPDEFYKHIFRLRGWQWKGRGKNPPQVVAAYTKDIVYARLAPQILEALEQRNPIESGRRKGAHHQLLTDDVGHPALAQHLHAVVTLMRVSKSWEQFKLMLDIAHPKRNDTLQLPLMADFETDPIQRKKDEVAGFKQTSLFDAPSDLASEPLQPSLPTDSAERP
jgi:hypothetical protein